MKQVFTLSGEVILLDDIPVPACGDGEVLVRNIHSAISAGTELSNIESSGTGITTHIMNKETRDKVIELLKDRGIRDTIRTVREERRKLSQLGYSSCGRVIEVGKHVTDISVGDIVACAGGGANHSEIVAVPRNLCSRVPESVSTKAAAFAAIGAIALQGIRRAECEIGDIVAVAGLGLIGLIGVQMLSAAGCRVIGIDISQEKLDFASDFGLEKSFLADENLANRINDYCDGIGADKSIIFAATSSNKPIEQAIEYTRKKGKIIVVGHVGMDIPRNPFYEKELDFGISCSYGPGRYDKSYEERGLDYPISYVRWSENRNMQEFLRLVSEEKIDMERLIEREYDIKEAENAYSKLNAPRKKPGFVLKYAPEAAPLKRTLSLATHAKPEKGRIGVGVIGAGSFAQTTHLPNIGRSNRFNLVAVAAKSGVNAKKAGEKFGAKYCTTDYGEILNDKNIRLVIISTRHDLHAKIALDSISAGKSIFVEKPLCLNERELAEIEKALSGSKTDLCVGFNRRFAPVVVETRGIIAKNDLLKKGMIINFRVNSAGMKDHPYINDPEQGGGAIVGEGCHFFDLMNFFMNAPPREILVSMPSLGDTNLTDTDNLVANIKYENGSLGSILYSTIGARKYPKERFEFFGKNTVIFIDDYVELTVEGMEHQRKRFKEVDKGHSALLEAYGRYLAGDSGVKGLPVNSEAINSMKLTFDVVAKLRKDGISGR
jgi:predicted dehydrogenase/threonine dehydrogenase-like Zn-dependent dehydrogenase